MALSTPTITEIQQQIISDIEAETGQNVPTLAKNVFRILAFALAGVFIILYKFGVDAFNQRFPQTANEDNLALLGELIDVVRQPATTWEGEADVVSTVGNGELLAGTQLVNNNTGVVYLVQEGVFLSIGTLTFKIAASVDGEGSIGNLNNGDVLDFVSPLPGLESTAVVSATTTAGEDEEPLETYRQRVLDGYQKKPQGGAVADYEQWAEEAPNVINAYPYASATPGQVNVYIEVDNQTDGIPTSDQLDLALEYINFDPITGKATRRPVTAEVFTLAITRATFDVEVIALSPDTPELRSDIEDALEQLLIQKEPYIQGLSIERKDTITQAELTALIQTIAAAAGSTLSGIKLSNMGSLIDLYLLGEGEKAKLGTVTYT